MITHYQISDITIGRLRNEYTEQFMKWLPAFFCNEENLVRYIERVNKYPFFSVFKNNVFIYFLTGVIHQERSGHIYVYGIHPQHHHLKVGKELCKNFKHTFTNQRFKYVRVKTLSLAHTNIQFPKKHNLYTGLNLWTVHNPFLIMDKYNKGIA